jgi:argininosuccinate synthase
MSTEENKRVVLAYSGGLDTSVILAWLIDKGYEVVAYCANIGQIADDLSAIKEKALACGAVKCYVEDLRHEFVTDYVFPLICSNAIYEDRYLLGTSIARPIISKRQVEIAHKENCKYLAHGATGKGNDQVRFELSANALDPTLVTIAPWRDDEFLKKFVGRKDLLEFAAEHKIQVDQTPKASYSMDENLFHISYESGILEDPALPPPRDMFKMTKDILTDAADEPERIRLYFKDGTPTKVVNHDTKEEHTDPLELFLYLNVLGKKHGIGRVDIVENRFVGIKSRGVYETPGGTILHAAHHDLETITMDREVMNLRDMLSPQFARAAYNGFWFAPEMEFLKNSMDFAQQHVDGWVDCMLYKGNTVIEGRHSGKSRYDPMLASMDEAGDYYPADAQGFIRINSLRLKAHTALVAKIEAENAADDE